MSDEHTVRASDSPPDEVQLRVIVVPLVLSAFLVAVVLLYRCRSHRLRRDRLAQEHQAELKEIAGERWRSGRSSSMRGLCTTHLVEKESTQKHFPNIPKG